MKKYNIVFLILHYLTIDYTKKCIKSILDKYKNYENIQIVVVDNNSYNNSGNELKEYYKNNPKVTILLSNVNLGFANGNNLGFTYAKKNYNADFIIMINNDTEIIQPDFIEQIISEYEYSKFAVLGPKIKLKNNMYTPIYKNIHSKDSYKKELKRLQIEYFLSYIYLYPLYRIIRTQLKKFFKRKDTIKYDYNERYENIVLHGCALIFSQEYINKFDGIDNRTFLFREEELLYLRLTKANLKNVYSPKIVIYHDEDSSTNALTKSKRTKRLFVEKNSIKSTKLLIDDLEEME